MTKTGWGNMIHIKDFSQQRLTIGLFPCRFSFMEASMWQ